MSLCKASAFARLVVNPFRRTMLLVNKVMTPKIQCEVGRSPGNLCALSKAGLIPFETIPVQHVCDQSFPKIRCAVSPLRYVVTILFGVMS